jgi:O-antigen/teichoic acid export membrane protein
MGWCVFALQDNVLTGLRRSVWVPVENAAFGIAKIALLIVFAGSFQQVGIFASWTIPAVVAIIPINFLIFRRLIPKHVAQTEKQATPLIVTQIVKFVAGDYIGSLFVEMSTTLLPVLVISQVGASANAHFYLAWIISYPLHLFSMNMAASLTVEGAADPAKFAVHARRALVQLARLLVPIVVIVLITAPYILGLFGADYADQASSLLRLLVLSAIPSGINALYMSFARVQRRIAGIVVVQGALCALVLSLSSAFIHAHGIFGVGIAWTASQTMVAIILLLTQLRPIFLPHVYQNARRPA